MQKPVQTLMKPSPTCSSPTVGDSSPLPSQAVAMAQHRPLPPGGNICLRPYPTLTAARGRELCSLALLAARAGSESSPSGTEVSSAHGKQPQVRPWCACRAHLLHRQLLQAGQGAGEQADEEGGGRAHDVDHGRRQHGDVGVLPGEGVKRCHCSVPTFRQSAGKVGEAQGWVVSVSFRTGWKRSGQVSLVYSAEAPCTHSELSYGELKPPSTQTEEAKRKHSLISSCVNSILQILGMHMLCGECRRFPNGTNCKTRQAWTWDRPKHRRNNNIQ